MMHGLQIWVALPKHLQQMDPEFFHIQQREIPEWTEGDLHYKLIAGEIPGKKSPVPVYSELYMIEIRSTSRQKVNFAGRLNGESGLYILNGSVFSDGNEYGEKQLLVAENSSMCEFEMDAQTTIYLFGGKPFPEERLIDWNFVSSEKDLIREAREKWINRTFGVIPGDDEEYIPYPELKK